MVRRQLSRRRILEVSTGALGGAALASHGLAPRRTSAAPEFAGKTVTVGTINLVRIPPTLKRSSTGRC